MRNFRPLAILMGVLCLTFLSSTTCAADYKDWIPLLPASINGHEKNGDADGANKQSENQSWSILEQRYSDGSGDTIRLTIVSGTNAPQVQQFQAMKQFTMETEERFVETLNVSGREAVLELYKGGGEGTLLISLHTKTIVVINADSVGSKKELTSLADEVPLSDIAAKTK